MASFVGPGMRTQHSPHRMWVGIKKRMVKFLQRSCGPPFQLMPYFLLVVEEQGVASRGELLVCVGGEAEENLYKKILCSQKTVTNISQSPFLRFM